MLYVDTKKPGRIVRFSHRVAGNRRDGVTGAGWETLFVAIDERVRIAFTAMHPDVKTPQAVQFLKDAVAHYAKLGVSIKRLLSDNGSALRSHDFARACQALGIKHRSTRAYRPQTNGKAERFIRSALREWAYGWTDQTRCTEPQHWPAGNTVTTGTARTTALAGPPRCPDSTRREATS